MVQSSRPSIQIDLNEFKLHLHLKSRTQFTLHFDSPSRKFYLSVIALVVSEMKKLGKIKSIPLQEHVDLLALLNESIGGAAGSSDKENLLHRIYTKWKDALPNLEEAPLFKVLGRKKEEGDGAIRKIYSFTDVEKDEWANLFEYVGSEENVRLKLSIDKIGVGLNEASIIFGDSLNGGAWEQFISSLKTVASVDRMKYPLPDRPSIAVLPFVNMSEDPKQEFLCDGMTEAIITALTKVPRMFVIARSSTFTYKGKPVKVKQVSEDLGVRYVLEGSLQRSGDRVRITAQLIDALTGNHLWAESFDRDLKDIFALQDEITIKVLTYTQVKLTEGGDVSSCGKYYRGKQGLDCFLKLTQVFLYLQRWNIEETNLARRIVEEVIAMCPENPMGYIKLGWVYEHDIHLGNTKDRWETRKKGIELAQKALAMDDSIAEAHALLACLYLSAGQYDRAIAEGERAVALDPGETMPLVCYGMGLAWGGRPEEAIPFFQKAIRLNPFGPPYLYRNFGKTLQMAGRFEEAVSALKKAIHIEPDELLAHLELAGTYIMMGRQKEARTEAAEVLRINPKFLVDSLNYPDNHLSNFRKAGLK